MTKVLSDNFILDILELFPMTDQHKATPEQWERQELRARLHALDDQDAPCILELRDRIAALEAAQQPRAFTGQVVAPITGSAGPGVGVALYLDPSEEQHGVTSDRLIARDTPAPAGSLVDRVAQIIAVTPLPTELWRDEARTAILEVAAWLKENDSKCPMGGEALGVTAELLEQEAGK